MRKLIDRLLWRFGYMRREFAISGEVKFRQGEQTFVNLALPGPAGGHRIYGWVNPTPATQLW